MLRLLGVPLRCISWWRLCYWSCTHLVSTSSQRCLLSTAWFSACTLRASRITFRNGALHQSKSKTNKCREDESGMTNVSWPEHWLHSLSRGCLRQDLRLNILQAGCQDYGTFFSLHLINSLFTEILLPWQGYPQVWQMQIWCEYENTKAFIIIFQKLMKVCFSVSPHFHVLLKSALLQTCRKSLCPGQHDLLTGLFSHV